MFGQSYDHPCRLQLLEHGNRGNNISNINLRTAILHQARRINNNNMLRIDPLLINHRQVGFSCFRNHKIAHDVFPGDVGVDGLIVFGLGDVLQFETGASNDEG
jgi:hypothetical protein